MGSQNTAWLAFLGGLIAALVVVLIVIVASDDDGGSEAATTATSFSTVPPGSTSITTTDATSSTTAVSVPEATVAPAATAAPTTAVPAITQPAPPPTAPALVNRCIGVPSMAVPPGAVNAGGANGVFGGGPPPESIMDADLAYLFESGGDYYVAFSLNVGYVAFRQLPDPIDPAFAPEILVVNFDGSDDGAWVKIDRSLASGAEVYAFYFLDEDCVVEDAGTADVDRYEFLDWGGLEHTQGFTCVGDGVYETFAGTSAVPGQWDVTSSFYSWTAPALPGFVLGLEDAIEVPDGDPEIAAAGMVDC